MEQAKPRSECFGRNDALRRALKIGVVTNGIYFFNYVFRNLLSVFTPQMLKSGFFTEDTAALYSSVYMIFYAVGQLFLGVGGDYVKPKYMVSAGLVTAAVGLALFPLSDSIAAGVIAFMLLGIGLSALRGPMVKVISENLERKHARLCCVFLSIVSNLGPFGASLLGLLVSWRAAFFLCAGITLLLAAFAFFIFRYFERSGLAVPVKKAAAFSLKDAVSVFRLDGFIPYFCIGMLIEALATGVGFWIPTCISEHLGYAPETAGVLYSVISAIKALCPFFCLFLLKLFQERDLLLTLVSFLFSAAAFMTLTFLSAPVAALFCVACALIPISVNAAILWNTYIPSLGKSGHTSGGNGILDCSGYFAAAGATLLFSYVMQRFDWNGVFLVWSGLALTGAAVAFVSLAIKRVKERQA